MQNELRPLIATPDSIVVKNLKRERDGKRTDTKSAIVMGPGGTGGGSHGAGWAIYLQEAGYFKNLFLGLGSSAGSANEGFALTGQARIGAEIYPWLTKNDFISPIRPSEFMRMSVFESALRTGDRRLDVAKLMASQTQLWVTVTNINGQGELLNAKDPKIDPIDAITASCTIPGAVLGPKEVNGNFYFDGAINLSLPVKEAITLGANNILLILNSPLEPRSRRQKVVEAIMARIFIRKFPLVRDAVLRRHVTRERQLNELPTLARGDIKINLIFPNRKVSEYCMDGVTLENFTREGYDAAKDIFKN